MKWTRIEEAIGPQQDLLNIDRRRESIRRSEEIIPVNAIKRIAKTLLGIAGKSFVPMTRTRLLVMFVVALVLFGCGSVPPNIARFSPTYGVPSTVVTVEGEQLLGGGQPNTVTVFLGTIAQPILSATDTEVQFQVAPGSVSGPIQIVNPGGTATSSDVFEVVDDASDPNGTYTFGGVSPVQAVKVTPKGKNQLVLIGILRARWSPNTGTFTDFQPDVDNAFNYMNSFWNEATLDGVSFQKQYLGNSIIDLPKSMDYYYHGFRQRQINSRGLPASINIPSDQTLVIGSDGQDISVTFTASNWTLDNIKTQVDNTIAAADPNQRAPTFTFTKAGSSFQIGTKRTGEQKGRLELFGGAVPWLGFGTGTLYNLGDNGAPIILFGTPLNMNTVTFPVAQNLVITTLGTPTTVNFPAGSMSVADIVTAIRNAYPGEAQQHPHRCTGSVESS